MWWHSKFGSRLCKIHWEKHPRAFLKVVEGSEIYNFPIHHFVHFYSIFWRSSRSNRGIVKHFRADRAPRRARHSHATHHPRPRLPQAARAPRCLELRAAPRAVSPYTPRRTTGPPAVSPRTSTEAAVPRRDSLPSPRSKKELVYKRPPSVVACTAPLPLTVPPAGAIAAAAVEPPPPTTSAANKCP
jgi:hypothetical protein